MRCYQHNAEDAVASCECGRALCDRCSQAFKPIVCEACALESNRRRRFEIYRDFALTMILFGLGFLVMEHEARGALSRWEAIWPGLLAGYLYASTRAGWIVLRDLQSSESQTSLIMPIPTWLILLFLKLLVVGLIGVIAFPIRVLWQLHILWRIRAFERACRDEPTPGLRLVYPKPT